MYSPESTGEQLVLPGTTEFSIYDQLPELVSVFSGEAFEGESGEFNYDSSKYKTHSLQEDAAYVHPIMVAITAAALEGDETIESRQYIKEMLLDNFDRASITDTIIDGWTRGLDKTIYKAINTRRIADNLLPELGDETEASQYAGFSLLKLLSSEHKHLRAEGTDDNHEALAILCTYDHFDYKSSGLVESIRTKLENGEYDGFIAQELLIEAVDNKKVHDSGDQSSDLRKMIKLLQVCGRMAEQEAIVALSTREGLASWESGQTILTDRRAKYSEMFSERLNKRKSVLGDNGYLLPEPTDQELETAIKNYKEWLASKGNSAVIGLKMTKADLARARADARAAKKKQRGYNGATDEVIKDKNQFPILESPRDIKFIDSAGYELTAEENGSTRHVNDFTKSNKGDDRLVNEVRETLDYLTLVDRSIEPVLGLMIHYRDVSLKGQHAGDIYQFKPTDNPYMKMLTKQGKRMRVLLTINDQEIKILSICDRSKIVPVKKALGLGVSSSVK